MNITRRVELVRNFGKVGDSDEMRALYAAFVACLTPQEACQVLDLDLSQEPPKRRAALRKIGRDVEKDAEECHLGLLTNLMTGIERQARMRQTYGFYLEYLMAFAPSYLQEQITDFFLSSKYISVRKRGYRNLARKNDWEPEDQVIVEKAWTAFHDAECAALIIDRFEVDYLSRNFEELEQNAVDYVVRRLYMRLIPLGKAALRRLSQADEITYAYILTKQELKLSKKEAFTLYERNKADQRIGLLIWCFGQMGLWEVLTKIHADVENIPRYRFAERVKAASHDAQ